MRVLIVASGNSSKVSPFVKEQADSLKRLDCTVDYFLIEGKGIFGYLKNYFLLKRTLKKSKRYDLIHAHYGLSGLLAALQSFSPVVITFHGSDVNLSIRNYLLSLFASRLADANIFVHPNLSKSLKYYSDQAHIIPCGVDLDLFKPISKAGARDKLGLDHRSIYVLFSSSFDNKIKNASLAKLALKHIDNITLIELKNYSRREVSLLLNAVDLLLVTSHSETGPLIVKEALACNCPLISTDVGDVKTLIAGTKNCFITTYDAENIARKIDSILKSDRMSNGRDTVKHLGLDIIGNRVLNIYKRVLV